MIDKKLLKRFYFSLAALLVFTSAASAQLITSTPEFPTQNDSIVIFFDAKLGDGGLRDFNGAVYAHTGVTTEDGQWQHVIGNWGDNVVQPQLTNLGNDIWQMVIGDPYEFYSVPRSKSIKQFSFVFRNHDGSRSGRNVGGADIFYDLFEAGLTLVLQQPSVEVRFGEPERSPVFAEAGDSLKILVRSVTLGTATQSMTLFLDDVQIAQTNADSLDFDLVVPENDSGFKTFKIIAADTTGAEQSTEFSVMVNPQILDAKRPTGVEYGVNVTGGSKVTLSLLAPFKNFVYVLGDFNDWKVDENHFMRRDWVDHNNVYYWLEIEGLDPNQEYAFQYLIDGEIRVAEPYAQKLLDPWNDRFINAQTYPNLKDYPSGKTEELVSTFQINRPTYAWEVPDFERPANQDLVIYELLIRDFIARHNYETMIDTLDYLKNLGINAVELLPINEFDGNESWGYNPAFYFAPDKYYGTDVAFKRFIDECHKRGMAVILDMVLNHSTGQSPLVRMYSVGNYGPPTAQNPWFNETAPNPFISFFEDFDHESPATKDFIDRVNTFWLTEFQIDGFRFDFTKGMTNKPGDGWAYDASRIRILKRMADVIWEAEPGAYVILEHFTENREEKELADYGMMVWGNMNNAYSQSAMGWLSDAARRSDLSWGYFGERGWDKPHVITYMESHDEPWLMYKNLQFGRSSGDYNVKELGTALDRIKLVSAFFLTIPGPKMLWQFGELGYDQDLPEDGRTSPKPILWQYRDEPLRYNLYKAVSALLKLRRENEAFTDPATVVEMRVGQGQYDRRIHLTHESMNVTVIGNFDVRSRDVSPRFQHMGWWYDFATGDSLDVTDTDAPLTLGPGEFHIFTTKRQPVPDRGILTSIEDEKLIAPAEFALFQNYPNPFNPETVISFQLSEISRASVKIYNSLGQLVRTLVSENLKSGLHKVVWNGRDDADRSVGSGVFFVRLSAGDYTAVKKIMLMK